MTIYKEQEVTETKFLPQETICDRCGRSKKDYEDFIEIRHEYGYGSSKDGDYIEADICEDCLQEIFRKFNINSRTYNED